MPTDVAARVLENQDLGGGYFSTRFDAPAIARDAQPGQFVMAGSGSPSELLLRRPFSVCLRGRSDGGGWESVTILYRVVGRGTAWLSRLSPGSRAALLGPLGRGFTAPRAGEVPVIAAGGIGIAAFPFWIETLREAGHSPRLFFGGRTRTDLPMLGWLRERVDHAVVATDDGSAGERALVTVPLERFLAAAGGRARIYACGPHAMMKATAEAAARHGAACEVALETPMACGYGVCAGCVVEVKRFEGAYGRYRRVCVEGPVFDAEEIVW